MDGMSDLARLVAVAALKDLTARRDHALDRKDWTTYAALHAPDHHSHDDGGARRDGAAADTAWIAARFATATTVHHSHSPVFTFDSPTRARGIWGVEDNVFWREGGEDCWRQGFGFHHETYERRDGAWLFTSRSLRRRRTIVTRRPTAA